MLELSSAWEMKMVWKDGESKTISTSKLFDLSKDPRFEGFGGEVFYKNSFSITEIDYKYLSLGVFHGVAELKINGQKVGTSWYGSPKHPIDKFLKEGENEIEIKITTTLGNFVKSLKDGKVARKWTQNQHLQPTGLIGPISFLH